jgi:hypothetical protein
MLVDLPLDVQMRLIAFAGGRTIPEVACTCSALRPLGGNEQLWRAAFEVCFHPVLTRWLHGVQPESLSQQTWRGAYARFERAWVSCVYMETGTVLFRLSGRLFDVTDFMDRHPGGPFLSAADLRDEKPFDVGRAFDLVGHSASAVEQLERMLVPPPPGRSCWPAPCACECPSTTFAVVSVADNVRRLGERLHGHVTALVLWVVAVLFHSHKLR